LRGARFFAGLSSAFAAKLADGFFERHEPLRVDKPQKAELKMQSRIGLAAQVVVGGDEDIEEAREIFFAESSGLRGQARTLILRGSDKVGIGPAHAGDEQIATMANCLTAEMLKILAVGDQAMNQTEGAFGGLRFDSGDEFVECALGDDAEKFADVSIRDRVARVGDCLLEEREAIAETAFGGAREHSDGSRIDFQIFGLADFLELTGNFAKGTERAARVT